MLFRFLRTVLTIWCPMTRGDTMIFNKIFLTKDFSKSGPQWLISDLIPKKSEKFEFRKNFVTIFFSVKNWPKKWNFDFLPTQFSKNYKIKSKISEWEINHCNVIVMKILWLKYPLIKIVWKIYLIPERISKVSTDIFRPTVIFATIKSMKFGDLYLMCCQYRIVNFGILVQ